MCFSRLAKSVVVAAAGTFHFLKSFTTLNTAKLINTNEMTDAVKEPSMDA
jgi:hypothetical protein